MDIDIDDPDSVELAVELVWGIKRLLHELSQGGQAAIDGRLAVVMGDRYSQAISQRLLGGLNPEIFAATAKRWLPNIEEDLGKRKSQKMSFHRQSVPMKLAAYARPAMLAQELLAENPLSGETFESRSASEEDDRASDETESGDSDRGTSSTALGIPAANTESSELLATNPLKKSSGKVTDAVPDSRSQSSVTSAKPRSTKGVVAPPKELSLLPEVAGVAMKFGWYRNDQLLKIGYRPKDHADMVVKSWSDCVSQLANADTRPATSALFAKLNSTTAAGSCRSCHTINRTEDDTFEFAWLADRREDARSSFTKFSHRPHLTQSSTRECATCHRMNESVSLVGTFESCDASEGMSNFPPDGQSRLRFVPSKGTDRKWLHAVP